MRAHQFLSADKITSSIVVIPFVADCTIETVHTRSQHHDGAAEVRVDDILIRDAQISVEESTPGGDLLSVWVIGTMAMYTEGGILDALAELRESPVHIKCGTMNGYATIVEITTNGIVTIVPRHGKIMRVSGAEKARGSRWLHPPCLRRLEGIYP